MHTIKLQLDDSLYEEMVRSGIDIKEKFQEFLADYVDDSYPAISTEEAKKRVGEAVEAYRNETMKTVSHEDVWANIESHTKSKSADSL